jgi:hypothetical protein
MNKRFFYSLFVATALVAGCVLLLSDMYAGIQAALSPAIDAAGSVLPIDRFASASSAPEVARIYYAIAVLLVPVGFMCAVAALVKPPVGDIGRREGVYGRLKRIFTALLLYAVSIFGAIAFTGKSMRWLPIGDTVLGLAMFGWVPMGAVGFLFGVASVFAWKALFNSVFEDNK